MPAALIHPDRDAFRQLVAELGSFTKRNEQRILMDCSWRSDLDITFVPFRAVHAGYVNMGYRLSAVLRIDGLDRWADDGGAV